MERSDRRTAAGVHAGEQLRIEGADMTPKVSCVVVAKKGHIWHEAGLAGGREYVVMVRPDGEDEDVEAVASRRLYRSVEPGDRLQQCATASRRPGASPSPRLTHQLTHQ